MNVSELKPRMRDVELILEVVELGPVREFQKFGENGRVATATVKDETGQVALTLWNEQIDLLVAGDKIKLENGFVNEWQGVVQLTTGRKGTITKL